MKKEKIKQIVIWLIVLSLCLYSVGANHAENVSQEIEKYYLGELSWETRLLDRYLEIESVSIVECAIECLKRRRCRSFNFSPVMNFCELCYVELANGRRDYSFTATAFLHSDVKTWNEDLIGHCSKHRCDLNSKCNLLNKSCEVSDMVDIEIAWFGGNDRDKEGHWVWESDSSPLQDAFLKQLWAYGEPNNAKGNEDCLIVDVSVLNDIPCNYKTNYICKI